MQKVVPGGCAAIAAWRSWWGRTFTPEQLTATDVRDGPYETLGGAEESPAASSCAVVVHAPSEEQSTPMVEMRTRSRREPGRTRARWRYIGRTGYRPSHQTSASDHPHPRSTSISPPLTARIDPLPFASPARVRNSDQLIGYLSYQDQQFADRSIRDTCSN